MLRAALAKSPDDRFATMEEFRRALNALATGEAPHPTRARRRHTLRHRAVLAAGFIGAVVVWMVIENRPGRVNAAETDLPRIAVLPFDNLGPAADQYFADGITDEIVSRLARVSGLAVLARQTALRYRESEKSPQEIGGELGVEYLLDATVTWQRPEDGPVRVRVRPSLIRGLRTREVVKRTRTG